MSLAPRLEELDKHSTNVPSPRSITSGAQVEPVVAQLPTSGRASDPVTVQVAPPSEEVATCMLIEPEFVANAYLLSQSDASDLHLE